MIGTPGIPSARGSKTGPIETPIGYQHGSQHATTFLFIPFTRLLRDATLPSLLTDSVPRLFAIDYFHIPVLVFSNLTYWLKLYLSKWIEIGVGYLFGENDV